MTNPLSEGQNPLAGIITEVAPTAPTAPKARKPDVFTLAEDQEPKASAKPVFEASNAFNTSPRPELTNDPYMVIAVVAVADGTQSTKALNVGTEGCIVNISTQTGTGVSESVTFISGVICIKDTIGDGFKLVKYRRTGTE